MHISETKYVSRHVAKNWRPVDSTEEQVEENGDGELVTCDLMSRCRWKATSKGLTDITNT